MSKLTSNYNFVKPELTDIPDITVISDNLDLIDSAIKEEANTNKEYIDNQIIVTREQLGSPLVAHTVSEMEDETHIYVYVGSETGYTAGNWYYCDGSDWVSGGVYNSEGIQTDKTLTVPNMAADAEVVGGEITDLKSAIYQINDAIIAIDNYGYVYPDFTLEYGYIGSADGQNQANNGYVRTEEYLPVAGHIIEITIPSGYQALTLHYNWDKSFRTYTSWRTGTFEIEAGETKYFRITIGKSAGTESISPELLAGTVIKEISYESYEKVFITGNMSTPIQINTSAKTVSVKGLFFRYNNNSVLVDTSVSYASTTGNTAFILYDWDNSSLVAMDYITYRKANKARYSVIITFTPSNPQCYETPFNVEIDGISTRSKAKNALCTIIPAPRSNAVLPVSLNTYDKILALPGFRIVDPILPTTYTISAQTIDYSSLDINRPVLVYYNKTLQTVDIYSFNNGVPDRYDWLWIAILYYYDMDINTPYLINGNLQGQNIQIPANIATTGDTINIDSLNKIVTFPVGTNIWNTYTRQARYSLTGSNNTVSYSSLNGTMFNIYYNVNTSTLGAYEYYLMPNSGSGEIFLGTVRQDGRRVSASFSCEYTVDGVPTSSELDGYWKQNLDAVIDKVALRQDYEHGITFAFITDIHWETNWKKSPVLMRYIANHSRVKLVLNGGDNASGGGENIDAQKKWLYECTGAFNGDYDYYSVNGNHDNNAVGGSELIGAAELRNLMLPNPNDVHYGSGNYYWFSNSGTTFICLDTGTVGAEDATQVAWAKNVIDTTTDNYIIILMHIIYLSNSEANPCTFFTNLITAINSATNKSKVQAIFAGHQHADHNYTFSDIPVVTTDTDSRFADDGITRAHYTLKEHCFDIVTINYDTKTINCDRVGLIGSDREISY